MWIVVEFPSEKSVEVIPNIWVINEDLVYWPDNNKAEKIKQLILKCATPDPSWHKCRARLMGKGKVYDSYQKAAEAASRAEYATDISDIDNETSQTIRLVKKPQRLISDDSSSIEDSGDDLNQIDLPSYDGLAQNKNIKNKRTELEKIGADKSRTSCENDILIELVKQVKTLSLKIDVALKEIAALGNLAASSSLPTTELTKKIIYNFPINSLDDLDEFDNKMKNEKEFYDEIVNFIIKRGGNTPNEHVKRCVGLMLTNEIQNKFNWLGQKQKKSFKELGLAKALIDGIAQNNVTEAEVENSIKKFLKHASDRLKAEQKS